MLEYLVKGRARRGLFRLLWGQGVAHNVSDLSRLAKVSFSAAHRELQAMRAAGLARGERSGNELVYRAETDHRRSGLLRQLATAVTQNQTNTQAREDNVSCGKDPRR
jgi:hypothetical protein